MAPSAAPQPQPADQNRIRPEDIGKAARRVVHTLRKRGYQTFVVGGSIRDLLLGRTPKDFDVATNARPEQVAALFPRARRIGRRFPIVHVPSGNGTREITEVTTFRSSPEPQTRHHTRHLGANRNYGHSMKEDAWRRDFTVNALYYAPDSGQLWDCTGGVGDLHKRCLRIIGDPRKSYEEDPVRMLRAAYFSAKLDFSLQEESAEVIPEMASQLDRVSRGRLHGEVSKIFFSGHGHTTFNILQRYRLFEQLFPQTELSFQKDQSALRFIRLGLQHTDRRVRAGGSTSSEFLNAMLLWPALQQSLHNVRPIYSQKERLSLACDALLHGQLRYANVPRRFLHSLHQIWTLQPQLLKAWDTPRAPLLQKKEQFSAARGFLQLRAAIEEHPELQKAATWWQQYSQAHPLPAKHETRSRQSAPRNSRPRSRRRPPTTRHPDSEARSPQSVARNPKPEHPSPKPDTHSPKPEHPSPKPEAHSPKPKHPSPKPETHSPKPKHPSPKPDTHSPKPKHPSPKPEAHNPKPKHPSPKPETHSPKPEDHSTQPETPSSPKTEVTGSKRRHDDYARILPGTRWRRPGHAD